MIPPDAHTPWGAGRVSARDLRPNGVNVVCREVLRDVALHVGGWRTSENSWEGGSDHDVFNRRGIPAALMWHFTDFTYHTSLDRMGMIDGDELRRTCAAIVSAGLALADLGPADVERHLASTELERRLRVDAATSAGNAAAVDAWESWCDGCAAWLRAFGADPGNGSAACERLQHRPQRPVLGLERQREGRIGRRGPSRLSCAREAASA